MFGSLEVEPGINVPMKRPKNINSFGSHALGKMYVQDYELRV